MGKRSDKNSNVIGHCFEILSLWGQNFGSHHLHLLMLCYMTKETEDVIKVMGLKKGRLSWIIKWAQSFHVSP